jgi:phi13 family phage major tail protein
VIILGTKKKNIPVGFDQLFYAVMTDEEAEIYAAPVRLPGARTMTLTPSVESEDLTGDDMIYHTEDALNFYDIELNIAELDTADQAALLGKTIDANGGIIDSTNDVAPYVALLYRRRMANKKYRYTVIYKTKFAPSEEAAETRGTTPVFQTPTISGKAIPLASNSEFRRVYTEGDPGVTPQFLSTFFDAVSIPSADTTPLTVTVDPEDSDTDVALNSVVTWTFNKAIAPSTVNAANFMVIGATGVLSLDSTGMIVTFTPASNLTTDTEYIAIVTVGVKSINGKSLATQVAAAFTTI